MCCLCFVFVFVSLWLVCTLSFKGRAIFRFLPFLWWSFLYGLHNLNVIAYSRLFPGFSLSAINLEFMTAAVLYKKTLAIRFPPATGTQILKIDLYCPSELLTSHKYFSDTMY